MNIGLQQIREPVLHTNNRNQIMFVGIVQVGENIDIGFCRRFPAYNRAEQSQVQYPSSLELKLVLANDAEDALLIHSTILSELAVGSKEDMRKLRLPKPTSDDADLNQSWNYDGFTPDGRHFVRYWTASR